MSFSAEVKSKIINTQFKNACCRRSFINGILFAKGYIENGAVCFNIEKNEYANFTVPMISEIYSNTPNVSVPPEGGRCKRVSFLSKACVRYLENLNSDHPFDLRCNSCQSAFIKGIFLSCGRITDPKKSYCLELSPKNNINIIIEYFSNIGIEMKKTIRRNENILYSKNSATLEDFFANAEMNDVVYIIMNTKIKKEFRNLANRSSNFVMINLSKVVNAAAPLLANLKKLEEADLLDKIPDDLKPTAYLRMQNPELSITQLARRSVPPISKSGLSHRMDRLLKITKEIIAKYKVD